MWDYLDRSYVERGMEGASSRSRGGLSVMNNNLEKNILYRIGKVLYISAYALWTLIFIFAIFDDGFSFFVLISFFVGVVLIELVKRAALYIALGKESLDKK